MERVLKTTKQQEHELATIVSIALYKKLFYGNDAITKLSPAIESGKKLLVLLPNRKRKKKEEGNSLDVIKIVLPKK